MLMMFSSMSLFLILLSCSPFKINTCHSIINDPISCLLVLCSIFIFMITNFMMNKTLAELANKLNNCTLLMILVLLFFTSSPILFFILFEMSLIPIFLSIFLWGYQPERTQASLYLALYTLTASFPLMACLIAYFSLFNTPFPMANCVDSTQPSILMLLAFTLSFSVKLPIFIFHLWLPKAHVEAPTSGSMILAAILLKLGAYGMWRFWPMFDINMMFFILASLAILSFMIINLMSFTQSDTKCLVAYSSIVHMSLIMLSLASSSSLSRFSVLILLISHAVISSALFYMTGTIFYYKNSRSMDTMKGNMPMSGPFYFLCFFVVAANMAAPPTIGFISEIWMLVPVLVFYQALTPVIKLAMLLIGVYCIIFMMNLFLNQNQENNMPNAPLSCNNFLVLSAHCAPLITLTLKLMIFL